jgi:hypothetical protein
MFSISIKNNELPPSFPEYGNFKSKTRVAKVIDLKSRRPPGAVFCNFLNL